MPSQGGARQGEDLRKNLMMSVFTKACEGAPCQGGQQTSPSWAVWTENKWDGPRFLGQPPETLCSKGPNLKFQASKQKKLEKGNQGGKASENSDARTTTEGLEMFGPGSGETHDSCVSPTI